MVLVEERVERLEDLLAEVFRAQAEFKHAQTDFRYAQAEFKRADAEFRHADAEFKRAQAETQHELNRLSREIREFKAESQASLARTEADTRALKDEMRASGERMEADTRALKEEMRASNGRMDADSRAFNEKLQASNERMEADSRAFNEKLQASNERMDADSRAFNEKLQASNERMEADTRALRDDLRASRDEMNKRWGDLANKMGTLAEDIVAPGIPRIMRQVTGCAKSDIELSAVRMKPRHATDPGRSHEFDVVVVCGEYLLLNETKSRLTAQDVRDFVETLEEARAFFPHYTEKKIIGAIASLYVDKSVVRYGERAGLLVLGMGEDLMDVLNTSDFVPREF